MVESRRRPRRGGLTIAVDSAWLEQNLGGPPHAEQLAAAAARPAAAGEPTPDQLARERIDFDGQAPQALARDAAWPAAPPTLTKYVPVDWPAGFAPQPAAELPAGESLPQADVLIVTWTVEEGRALARVLTPGYESHLPSKGSPPPAGLRPWKPYTKNFATISAKMKRGCPALSSGRLGSYWKTQIGDKQVVVFKSESHMSQDGPEALATTPNRLVWQQLIADCKPSWVITTGTAGGIGAQMLVGDVLVTPDVTFDSGGHPPQLEPFACAHKAPGDRFKEAAALFAANAQYLPKTNGRAPRIVVGASQHTGVVTTRGFQYDDTANKFELKGKGDVCEMGDAVLGYVCAALGAAAPSYAMVRNVSDPEIDSNDPEAGKLANYIYEHFGRWSSVCSAIVCWSIVAAL